MKFFYDINPINESTYKIKIQNDNTIPLYKSIQYMLDSVHYDSETTSIYVSAEKVTTLYNFTLKNMSHNICIKMIDDLTKQMIYLKKIQYGFYGLNIEDIVIIDNTFIVCSSQHLLPIEEDRIIFYSPIKQTYFSNPEIMKLTTLPSEVDYKCVYYSLGSLIIFCLLKKYLLVANEIKNTEEVEYIITPIKNTKIYWFLKRCLEENIEKRILLLI